MHLFMAVIAIANAYVMWLIASTFFAQSGNPLRQRLPAHARHAPVRPGSLARQPGHAGSFGGAVVHAALPAKR
jgi:hypothetical protein